MSLACIPQTLVHAHLPCPPTIPNTIPELRIPTDRDFPDLDPEDGLFHEHALSFSYNPDLNVLARATHNGYVLELRAFDTVHSSSSPPPSRDSNTSETIRIVFPDRIASLSEGCLIVSTLDRRVYILVYTEADVLYRLNFHLGSSASGRGSRSGFTVRGNDDWVEEWQVPQDMVAASGGVGVWHALDELNVVLGCGDGGIIRLARSSRGINGASRVYFLVCRSLTSGSWSAHQHRISSRFRLPSLFSSASSDEQVLSFASYQVEEDLTLLYAFSRDRKLRVWNGFTGHLLKTVDVKATSVSREVALRGSQVAAGSSQSSLPDFPTASLVRVIPHPNPSSKTSHIVVVFAPPAQNSSSSGSFLVYRIGRSYSGSSDISLAGERPCSAASIGAELRGFEVLAPVFREGFNSGWRLCAAWDQKGAIAVESIAMDDIFQFTTVFEHHQPIPALLQEWHVAATNLETTTFDTAYFDNLLSLDPPDATAPMENGDIGQTFISHLFYPGRFSVLSLTTALEEYIGQLPRNKAYAEIGQSFASLAKKYERIIGCDLEMDENPQTGAPEVQEYRNKLKLQWLGIWARVRNLDTGARWPLGTVVVEDQLVVVTREGVSAPVLQDACAVVDRLGQLGDEAERFLELPQASLQHLFPALAAPSSRSSSVAISAAGTHLAGILSKTGHNEHDGSALEVIVDHVNGYVARPFSQGAESFGTELWDNDIAPYLSEEDRAATRRLLSECSHLPQGLSDLLDLLASTHSALLQAADDRLRFSGMGNALLAASIASAIQSRYRLARNILLIAILNLIESGDVHGVTQDSEDCIHLLYRAFTTYQRYRVLYFVSEQAADEARNRKGSKAGKRRGDDTVSEGTVSAKSRAGEDGVDSDDYETAYSLLHSLLSHNLAQDVQESSLGEIAGATTAFLSSILSLYNGLWDNVPLEKDVRLAFDVLDDGHPTVAGTMTTFYPDSAGMFYVRARAYLDLGDIEEAVAHFEKAASGYRDKTLASIIPGMGTPAALALYYRHVAKLFEDRGVEEPIVRFGKLALQSTSEGDESVKDIWTKVFLASMSTGAFDEAYVTLTSTPHPEL